IERLAVVVMVAMDDACRAALLATLRLLELTVTNRVSERNMRRSFLRVALNVLLPGPVPRFSPGLCLCIFPPRLDSMGEIGTRPVILAVVIKSLLSVLANVRLCALLALVQVAIRHPSMPIELTLWLLYAALETLLH